MLKRLITAAVGVVGAAVVGLGVASATVWRADDVLVADTTGSAPVVVTDPGVLELGGDPVTVTVTAPDDAPVVVAVGRDTDVAGWVADDAHTVITGLAAWHVLATDEIAAVSEEPTDGAEATAPAAEPTDGAEAEAATDPAAAVPADPTGSDLWVAEQTGSGSVELVWPATEGRWSLVAVSTSGQAPTVSLAWPRTVTTPWLWPCVVVGSLLILGALAVALRGVRRRRAPEPAWTPVTTGSTPVVATPAGQPMTRRQMREAALHGGVPPERPAQPSAPGLGRRAAAEPSPSARPEPAAALPHPTAPGQDAQPWASSGRDVDAGSTGAPAPTDAPSSALLGRLTRRGRTGEQPPTAASPSGPTSPSAPAGPSWPRSVGAGTPEEQTAPVDGGLAARPGVRGVPGVPAATGPGVGPAAVASPGADAARGAASPAAPGVPPGAYGRGASTSPATGGPVADPSRPDAPFGAAPRGVPGPTAPPAAGRPAWPAPTSSPRHPGGEAVAPAAPGPSAGPVREAPSAPHGRPSWASRPGTSAASGVAPGAAPAPEPTRAPTTRPPADPRTAPASPTTAPAVGAPTPGAPGVGARPGGWSPTLPPPGATLRPGSGTGPDDPHAAAGRPAWLASGRRPDLPVPGAPAAAPPSAPAAGEAEASGSRADAWRRAWGLPQGEAATDEQRGQQGEETR